MWLWNLYLALGQTMPPSSSELCNGSLTFKKTKFKLLFMFLKHPASGWVKVFRLYSPLYSSTLPTLRLHQSTWDFLKLASPLIMWFPRPSPLSSLFIHQDWAQMLPLFKPQLQLSSLHRVGVPFVLRLKKLPQWTQLLYMSGSGEVCCMADDLYWKQTMTGANIYWGLAMCLDLG